MKELLQQQGWKCSKCNCPGKLGYDCANAKYRDYIIKLVNARYFRIFKKGHVVASGHNYQLEAKLKEHELVKETV